MPHSFESTSFLLFLLLLLHILLLLFLLLYVVVDTNLLLNQAWIWAYFPHFTNNAVINPVSRHDKRAFVRDGTQVVVVPSSKSVERLRQIRRILDGVSFKEVRI